ncbi:hypothetical protein, partial [Pseudomonas sp. MD195_PC81_125]|uniref:hypothetical protein n=1 Tax=Pseudomonas sp. MD195_PC81_125 TaxID=2741560 RepID=UPI001C711A08
LSGRRRCHWRSTHRLRKPVRAWWFPEIKGKSNRTGLSRNYGRATTNTAATRLFARSGLKTANKPLAQEQGSINMKTKLADMKSNTFKLYRPTTKN